MKEEGSRKEGREVESVGIENVVEGKSLFDFWLDWGSKAIAVNLSLRETMKNMKRGNCHTGSNLFGLLKR